MESECKHPISAWNMRCNLCWKEESDKAQEALRTDLSAARKEVNGLKEHLKIAENRNDRFNRELKAAEDRCREAEADLKAKDQQIAALVNWVHAGTPLCKNWDICAHQECQEWFALIMETKVLTPPPGVAVVCNDLGAAVSDPAPEKGEAKPPCNCYNEPQPGILCACYCHRQQPPHPGEPQLDDGAAHRDGGEGGKEKMG